MVSMIAVIDKNRVIGLKGQIPWNLPADKQYFREKIKGQNVLAGRRVYDSFPQLPDIAAQVYVLTNEPETLPDNVRSVASVEEAVNLSNKDLAVIGGGITFAQALPYADTLYLTEIEHEFEGDTYFPEFASQFHLESATIGEDETFPYTFSFNVYKRSE